jgi:hypothetical protein
MSSKNEEDVGSILEGTLHWKKVTSWYVQHFSSTVANVKPQYGGRSLIDDACMKQGENLKSPWIKTWFTYRASADWNLELLNQEPRKYNQYYYKGQSKAYARALIKLSESTVSP